jgi:hypothetical protein
VGRKERIWHTRSWQVISARLSGDVGRSESVVIFGNRSCSIDAETTVRLLIGEMSIAGPAEKRHALVRLVQVALFFVSDKRVAMSRKNSTKSQTSI